LALLTGGKAVATVTPDSTYPAMYRIDRGGVLSDMVNLSRTKDAARTLAALAADGRQSVRRRPPVRRKPKGAQTI
jgi:hypothetical protein